MRDQDRWRPTASWDVIRKRASVLERIRALFSAWKILEVETPALSMAGTTDPSIDSFSVRRSGQIQYLHTSPEFPMKRFLAAGSGDIYQLCKVFRQGESGKNHNPEFTLLEWYRLNFDHHQLMDEVVGLVITLADEEGLSLDVKKISYVELFQTYLSCDPMRRSTEELEGLAKENGIDLRGSLSKDQWLDLLMSHCVMPKLPNNQLTVLYDYPASQASLAKINADGLTAARFEVFWGSLELANGFHELQDAEQQRQRFLVDVEKRREQGKEAVPLDEHLIQALRSGLPPCAGVALGIDRLLMKLTRKDRISEVLGFPVDRA